jgi:hypothetical protein
MNSLVHIISNILVGAVLYYTGLVTSMTSLLIFISFTVLIDIDHVFYFLYKHRSFSFKKMIRVLKDYHYKIRPNTYVFHSIEFNSIIIVLSFFNSIFLLLLLSNVIHITLDVIEYYNYHGNLKCIRNWSIINMFI